MRKETVENNQIVIQDQGVTVRYSLSLVKSHIAKLRNELKVWHRRESLLTPRAADEAPCDAVTHAILVEFECNYCDRCGVPLPRKR